MSDGGARTLLFSMRNLATHVSCCQRYEFEDVIAASDSVQLLAPRRPPERGARGFDRYSAKILHRRSPLIDGEIHLTREYELFVAMCRRPKDLRYIRQIRGLREQCRVLACLFDEAWPDEITGSSASDLELLGQFDFVFLNVEAGVEPTRRLAGIPTRYMPYGVDALSFCPHPDNPNRCIDVLSMGRRPEGLHRVLLERADKDELFYVYDTASNFSVIDAREHRRLLSSMIKRSRYFIAYPGRFDQGPPQFLLGNRYFEGAAGGAILLGMGPANTLFEQYFDWPEAVFDTPTDGSQVADLIGELDSQPVKLSRLRRNGVVNSLLRHDWVYRWRQIRETAGLQVTRGIIEREQQLRQLADTVAGESI